MPILTKSARICALTITTILLSAAGGLAHADGGSGTTQPPSNHMTWTGIVLSPDGLAHVDLTEESGTAPGSVNGAGVLSGDQSAAQKAILAVDPSDCGVFGAAGAQRCQCATTTGASMLLDYGECTVQPAAPGAPQPPSQAAVLAAVRSASATLQLPDGVPVVAPDPANNEWNMIPIGYPIWLTTTAPAKAEASTVQDGISITITATRGTTVFAMGEPKQKVSNPYVSCTQMAQRKLKESPPDKKSPNCGYVYKVMGTYTIQATTTWKLTWTANQYSGTLYTTRTAPAAKPLTIGQLRAVIVADEP